MQKKELILLASLLNALILAFLLTTAVHESIPQANAQLLTNSLTAHAENLKSPTTTSMATTTFSNNTDSKVISLDPWPHDEVDHALQPYLSKQDNTPEFEPTPQVAAPSTKAPQEDYQEVVVKRGDALDKIARQHGISVKEIKRINQLTTDRLSIGQLLILPKNSGSTEIAHTQRSEQKISVAATQDVQAYIMKSGDNPWKIAKAHKMKPEDLLELNGWTEESARNLKPGDSIRVYATPR